jgi:hypothetical protein
MELHMVGGPADTEFVAAGREFADELGQGFVVGVTAGFGAEYATGSLAIFSQSGKKSLASGLRKMNRAMFGIPVGSATGVVIASQSGHRLGALTAEQDAALATTPAEELLQLPMLQPDQVTDSLNAYQLAKRGNSLRGWPRPFGGASGAPGSTPSVRASSSPRSLATN